MDELAELVASAFGVGPPLRGLQRIQVSAHETWRLDTVRASFLVKRLWNGDDPPWRSEYEIAMELERRARQVGIATAVPVLPVEPIFGWAARIDGHGAWRAYEWLEHSTVDAADIPTRWFGDTMALLHTLYPLGNAFEPEWRWLGVYPQESWERWLDAADQKWVATAEAELERVLAITEYVRRAHRTATDHIVSHLDFGPWNVLRTAHGLVLIDWDAAGSTTAGAELGRALGGFGGDDPARMRSLRIAYQEAGGVITCRTEDLFVWQISQRLSGITERIRIAVGDISEHDDPDPVWMNAETIDADIIDALTALPAKLNELKDLAAQVMIA